MTPAAKIVTGVSLTLLFLCVGLTLVLPLCSTTSCTPQARSEADAIAIDLTNMVCSPSDPLDANPVVEIVCVAAEGIEKDLADSGVNEAVLHVGKVQAARILQRHGKRPSEVGSEAAGTLDSSSRGPLESGD